MSRKSNAKYSPTPIKQRGVGLVSGILQDIHAGNVRVIYQSPITTDSQGRRCRTITIRGNRPKPRTKTA